MSKTLISILCDEETWAWDNHTCTIAFNEIGTGELRCQRELNIWIAAEFDWKLQNTPHVDESININTNTSIDQTGKNPTTPHLISQFEIEITLAKRCIPSLRSRVKLGGYQLNEAILLDEAFRPKTYTVRLEKGNFLCPYDAMLPKEDEFTPRFALRLAFDKSPYPPRHEWRHADGAPDAVRMWEWKEFCARRQSPELKALAGRNSPGAGAGDSAWGKCVVS